MSVSKTGLKTIIAIAGISSMIAAGTNIANAGNFGVDLTLGDGIGIYLTGHNSHRSHRHKRHNVYPGYYYNPYQQPYYSHKRKKHRHSYNHQQRRHVCGPRRAVKKAYRLGLDNPQVLRVKERRIVVAGFQYGYRTKMVFKRYSNCHLIKTVNFNR